MTPRQFTNAILRWYDVHGRKDLPWQKNIDPYRVWVSEIMLQQTQVVTVIPYYHQFMQRFPNLTALANATEDEVLELWTGLGYYSRARNLLRAAKLIKLQFNGNFPTDIDNLQQLPGIGRSTAGAILAIAFNQAVPILDGNVKRVLTRFHAIKTWPEETKTKASLWEIATHYTSKQRPAAYTQAIMDLGATVCKRSQPLCHACPIHTGCQAFATGEPTAYPAAKPKTKRLPIRKIQMLILIDQKQRVLIEKRPPTGIWPSLWSLPECPIGSDPISWCQQNLGLKVIKSTCWQSFRHTFSHFHLEITPIVALTTRRDQINDNASYHWQTIGELPQGGIAAPIKQLLITLANQTEELSV